MKDGGPAFPRPAGPEPRVNEFHEFQDGMTLRDYFAAHRPELTEEQIKAYFDEPVGKVQLAFFYAQWSIVYADAMIAARAKGQ